MDEYPLYAAMDWPLNRQSQIEDKLARSHLSHRVPKDRVHYARHSVTGN